MVLEVHSDTPQKSEGEAWLKTMGTLEVGEHGKEETERPEWDTRGGSWR